LNTLFKKYPAFLLSTTLHTTFACVLCFVPLFDLLAFEFCFAISCLAALSGPLIGYWQIDDKKSPPNASMLRSVFLQALTHTLPALVVILLNALRIPNCNFTQGLMFFVCLPIASSVYGAALGLLFSLWTHHLRKKFRIALFFLLLAVPLLNILWGLYTQPAIFVFDHLWGYFPGSLYDEGRRVDGRLIAFRGFTLLRLVALWIGIHFTLKWKAGQTKIVTALVGLIILSLSVITLEYSQRKSLGFYSDRHWIEENLSERADIPGLTIHMPPSINEEQKQALIAEHQHHLASIKDKLGLKNPQKINSYVYLNRQQKETLMGGAATMIAKPWLNEIHIHHITVPHPILAHELVHALASNFGSKLLGVSARFEIFVNMGLVEGLAEALSTVRGPLDLHQAAKALIESGKAPKLENILASPFFWTQSARRAYSLTGSFLRFLLEKYGTDAIRRLYANADFIGVYDKDLKTLLKEWEEFIAKIKLQPHEKPMAKAHFKRKSIFKRPCAHEISYLKEQAQKCTPTKAIPYYEKISALLGHATTAQYELALAFNRADAREKFEQLSHELLSTNQVKKHERHRLLERMAVNLWTDGRLQEAQGHFQKLLQEHLSINSDRLQWVRIWALNKEATTHQNILAYLEQEMSAAEATLFLQESLDKEPEDKTWAYLLGRHLFNHRAYTRALSHLEQSAPHPFKLIEGERIRLLAETHRRLKNQNAALENYLLYAKIAPLSGEQARAAEWVNRLQQNVQNR
jgi:hypothetical protein